VRRVLPNADIEVGPGISEERPNYNCLYDISRARADLGFQPRFSIGEAVEDYIEILRQIKLQG
jgi:nucleoside-diphosphate-sugar epimerase